MIQKEKIIDKQRLFTGNYLSLETWKTHLSDTISATREIVIAPNAVGIVPVDENRQIHLVRQARPAVGEILLEIPAGLIDAGESPEQAARRECSEEINLIPGNLRKILTYYHAEGYSTGVMTLFLGTELAPCHSQQNDQDEVLEHIAVPLEQAANWIRQGKFKDSKSMLGILFAIDIL
ncbi:NUDIX hydrolase [candidate division KSB1 bacterium]|nr:NUDIX hydrolase [candidate division KSB1 bacterium]